MRQLCIRLKVSQRRRLESLRDHAPSPRVVKRAMCLLLSAAGESVKAISRITGLSLNSITNIRRRWRDRHQRSLEDRPRSGRPPRVTAEYRRELRRAIRRGPLAFGYIFTVWSVARLNSHLRRITGIELSHDWLRRVVHEEGFVIGRPKHTLRGKRNERAYQRTRQRLDRLKKGP